MICFFLFVHHINGGKMKKIIVLSFSFFIIFSISIKSNYLLDNDSYDEYTLVFENLSTNNILDYFSDIDIIKIYPYINPIYKDRLNDLSYEVRGYNLLNEINIFKNKYLDIIKKNSYLDYNYLYVNGINIYKMDVYMSSKDLYDILNSGLLVQIIK